MQRTMIAAALAAGIAGLGVTAASAQSLVIGDDAIQAEPVRLVCNEWGRCWNTGPRYGYRYGYGPRYRYYGPRYHGYYGDYGPGYYREPGLTFRFGF